MTGRLSYWLDLLDRIFEPFLWPPARDVWITDPPPRWTATMLDNPPCPAERRAAPAQGDAVRTPEQVDIPT